MLAASDVTIEELRIECMFPADEATAGGRILPDNGVLSTARPYDLWLLSQRAPCG